MNHPNVRGQATTELALGSLVFVVVLMFGIYFGEVPVMMLKVKEAAGFSMHRATGARTHMFSSGNIGSGTTYSPFSPAEVENDVRSRYRDYDGMSDRSGGSTFTQAMTSTDNFNVQCAADNRVRFRISRPAGGTHRAGAGGQASYDDAFDYLRNRFKDRGGISCKISSNTTPFRLPTSFVDTGAGRMSQETLKARAFIKVCGAGRPSGNSCPGELLVLTGDWGFDAPMGSPINGDAVSFQEGTAVNEPYVKLVKTLYEENGKSQGDDGRELVKIVAGLKPSDPEWLDESLFNMSFRGDEGARDEVKVDRFVVDAPNLKYQTSGADMRSNYVGWSEGGGVASGIPTCFLGLKGCAP